MTKLFLLLTGLILLASTSLQPEKSDEKSVEQGVITWADSIFYYHEEYRFEQYHAEYTDEYQIATLRLKMYQGRQENLEKIKQKGFYKKTEEEYTKKHNLLVNKNIELKYIVENFQNKAKYYQILFWSNIKTNQGPTVYYSHLVTLNNDFKVTSAIIKSEIGKKNDKTKIIYAKGTKKKK